MKLRLPHRNDDPFDTWLELFAAWAAIMFTALVLLSVFSYFVNCR